MAVRNPDQTQRSPSQRGLATAGLTDDGDDLAGLNVQRHAVYSMDRLTAKETFANAEMNFDIMELNQRIGRILLWTGFHCHIQHKISSKCDMP